MMLKIYGFVVIRNDYIALFHYFLFFFCFLNSSIDLINGTSGLVTSSSFSDFLFSIRVSKKLLR
jgi:multisubunit Na+/H+ antiporter MnhE subunit